MTTPTGTIGLSNVNTELGRPSNQQISMNDSAVRSLAGVSSGQIAMSQLRGKSTEDFTPDPVNWANENVQLISGINVPITLSFGFTQTGGSGTYSDYKVTMVNQNTGVSTLLYQYNSPTGATVTVTNGQYTFITTYLRATAGYIASVDMNIRVYNDTAGGVLLNSFTTRNTDDNTSGGPQN